MNNTYRGSLITWNLNGIVGPDKLDKFLRGILAYNTSLESKESKISAIAFQEHALGRNAISRAVAKARTLRILLVFSCQGNHTKRGSGTGIAIPYSSIERKPNESIQDAVARVEKTAKSGLKGGVCSVRTLINGRTCRIASVYAPAEGRVREVFIKKLDTHLCKDTLVGADWNCVRDETLDLSSANPASNYDNRGADELTTLMTAKDLHDIARDQLGSTREYTHHQRVNTLTGHGVTYTRLDYWLIPTTSDLLWTHSLSDMWGTTSDHRPVELAISAAPTKRGRDIESIDDRVLDEPGLLKRLTVKIDAIRNQYVVGPNLTYAAQWERIKKALRSILHAETKKMRERRKAKIAGDHEIVNFLQKRADRGLLDSTGLDRLEEAKRRCIPVKDELLSADNAYSKMSREEAGLAPFYRVGKASNSKSAINRLKRADWTDPSNPTFTETETDPSKIADAATSYYQSLFAAKPSDPVATEKCLDTLRTGPRIEKTTADECGAEITADEAIDTCAHLPTGKSPGPDRLPNALYKRLSTVLGPILAKVFNEARKTGALPPSLKQGLVSILYKKKDREDIRNYRPITLLNGDYKVFTRILTRRTNKAVTEFVSQNQAGFVPGAFLNEVTMALQLAQEYMDGTNDDGLFIFLDMEKAFDRVSWPFLRKTIREAGMGDDFLAYFDLMYNEASPPTRQIFTNGYLGPSFPISSGVAQGCPLSPLLFLFCTEPLIRLIARNKNIKGLQLYGVRIKSLHFADDTTLTGVPADVPHYNRALDTWQRASAMKENLTKREGLLLGRLAKHPERAPTGVIAGDAWTKDGTSIRCLGVPIGRFSTADFWKAKTRATKERMSKWRSFGHRSTAGRNALAQAFYVGCHRFWFNAVPIATAELEAIQSDYDHLVWARDPHLDPNSVGTARTHRPFIRKHAASRPRRRGGANVMSIANHVKATKAAWLLRYLAPRPTAWKSMLDNILGIDLPEYRGSILNVGASKLYKRVPIKHIYLRQCLRDFGSLGLKPLLFDALPNTEADIIVRERLANSLFRNPEIPSLHTWPDSKISVWENTMEVRCINDLFDYTQRVNGAHEPWDDVQWFNFAAGLYEKHHPGRRANATWCETKAEEALALINALPSHLRRVASSPAPRPLYHVALASVQNDRDHVRWARMLADGLIIPTRLDSNRQPRPTTLDSVPPLQNELVYRASLWGHDPSPESRREPLVRGSIHSVMAPDRGWCLSIPGEPDVAITLSSLTISKITTVLTRQIDAEPSCQAAWEKRLSCKPDWAKIWASFGTFITNPTDEKTSHKLAHRHLFTRSAGGGPTVLCRRGCGAKESQHHLAECRFYAPFWDAIFAFLSDTMGTSSPHDRTRAVCLGIWDENLKLAAPPILAVLRISLRMLYATITEATEKESVFVWQQAHVMAMRSLRTKCLARCEWLRRRALATSWSPDPFYLPVKVSNPWASLFTVEYGGQETYVNDDLDSAVRNAIEALRQRRKRMAVIAAKRARQRAARCRPARPAPQPAPVPQTFGAIPPTIATNTSNLRQSTLPLFYVGPPT